MRTPSMQRTYLKPSEPHSGFETKPLNPMFRHCCRPRIEHRSTERLELAVIHT
ncbi:hypothetical protein T02_6958 [Trichinella nativa]|uniref:Uncharacterized protein n=1 Tax=Trichinella nativa TaxID=6335 RepID=A0A0V1KJ73_9BILA|nr:hypothetical protein T02_6958 [Trichinella nativa]